MVWIEKYAVFLSFITAFAVTYMSIPALIRLSLVKKLYDEPDERKLHNRRTSSLGGVGIVGGFLFAFIINTIHIPNAQLNAILAALIVLFVTGVKDDLFPMVPYKKLLGQLIAIGIVTVLGDVRLTSLYGLADVWELPYSISVGLSMFFYIGIINSFNFIDGINGLSASIGVIVSLAFGFWFWKLEETFFLILSLSMTGALLAFLRYNLFSAKIFMGDSGSMVLGFFAAILTINFLKINELAYDSGAYFLHIDAMLYALAVIVIPVVDTLRVVSIRVFIKKTSPFHPDRNHIHHVLLDIGCSHSTATLLLAAVNLFFILLVWMLNPFIRATFLFILIMFVALLLSQIPFLIKKRQKLHNANPNP